MPMLTTFFATSARLTLAASLFVVASLGGGCGQAPAPASTRATDSRSVEKLPPAPVPAVAQRSEPTLLDPCALALVAHRGTNRVDEEIAKLQDQIRKNDLPHLISARLDMLGWLFIRKARESFDSGFYKLAEQCALCLETTQTNSFEALLLRGHVLHNVHRFKEAEPIARRLVSARGIPADYGLLGDVLMELGHLTNAIEAYQQMMDLKPDLHAYARAAHLRWLKGDLEGAIEAMATAADAAHPSDAESGAWVNTRLALYQWQAGQDQEARESCDQALEFQNDYPPALLARGRMRLAQGQPADAVPVLRLAVSLNPLPEYQWALAEALRAAGRAEEAKAVETQLHERGSANDPRTLALFLATRREHLDLALKLAQRELRERGDVHTHDALAWALMTAGRASEARQSIDRALAEGTKDARLFFHAAVIAAQNGQADDARRFAQQADIWQHMLLPSEREQLRAVNGTLRLSARTTPERTAAAKPTLSN